MERFDYLIVGAGPTGLTLAYVLGKQGKKVLVVEREDAIGGCHRVKRLNGLFTEHSPRVYLNSYKNMKHILLDMGSSFEEMFTPYDFSVWSIAAELTGHVSWWELFLLFLTGTYMVLHPSHLYHTSVREYGEQHGFSASTMDYLDRVCRVSDGAGADRYTMYQLVQLVNQQGWYGMFQPKKPLDVDFWPLWSRALERVGVPVMLNTSVTNLMLLRGRVSAVQTDNGVFGADKVVLAVPPPALQSILSASSIGKAFGPTQWYTDAAYNSDIAATFHWDSVVTVPKKWGFPASDWGVVSIVLTHYMDMQDARSKTVISTCITYLDVPSKVTGLTANQTLLSSDLTAEIFRQLQETYPSLPAPTTSILSPTAYIANGKWNESDSGFFRSNNVKALSSRGTVANLFQVGTQNGNCSMDFTTMEAAVTNALVFANEEEQADWPLATRVELLNLVRWFLVAVLILLILILWYKYRI